MATSTLLILAVCLAAVNEYLTEATQRGRVDCADDLKYLDPSWGQEHNAASHSAGERAFEGMDG